ncbi:hypothetical protein D3C76_1692890 [compost metagenome]
MLDVQEKIEQAFRGHFTIKEGFVTYPFEVDSVRIDGTLQCSFEIYYIEFDETDDGEDITELNLSIEKRD